MNTIIDFFRSFLLLEMLQGLSVTLRNLFRRKITIQYPEEKTPASPRLEVCMLFEDIQMVKKDA